jgi:glucosylceramidase
VDDNYFYDTYARYFMKVLEVYNQRGVEIHYFTLQNEPLFGNSDQYPGMYLNSANAYRLSTYLSPLLAKYNQAHSKKIEIMAYDHNWDHPEYPEDVINRSSKDSSPVHSVAWHCYGGDMATAHSYIHDKFPTAKQYITECTGVFPDGICDINRSMEGFGGNHEWDMANILLGPTSYWSSAGIKWILALDENCGPILPTVTFDFGRPFVSIPSWASVESDIKWNQDFWSMAHMSKFISKGSYRVISKVTNNNSGSLLTETFYDEQRRKLVCIIMNKDHDNQVSVSIADGKISFATVIPPYATKVYEWDM